MTAAELVILAFKVSILCTVFGFGLKASIDDCCTLRVTLVFSPGP